MPTIRIPNEWTPRDYQLKAWSYIEKGGRRACLVWHRRAGKDSLCINMLARKAITERGNYAYMLPTYAQARKVVWDAIDKQGRRVIKQAFPEAIVKSYNAQEMKIELVNGSIIQLAGSDSYDNLVGTNYKGMIFSEYSIADPAAWELFRPILAENGGWALFIYTPRGHNHGYELYEMAKNNPDWFCQRLSIEDTKAVSLEMVEAERQAGMDENTIQQEFYCSFDAAIKGSYYGDIINKIDSEGAIGAYPYDPSKRVITAWDLGYGDATAIWFCQQSGTSINIIDYYEAAGMGLDHYAQVLQSKGYIYKKHILPHDSDHNDLTSGISRTDYLKKLGISGTVLPRKSVEAGIAAVRMFLLRCRFNEKTTVKGLECLKLYRKEWDEKRQDFNPKPLHDKTSHAADAFRYLAMGFKEEHNQEYSSTRRFREYDPLA